MIKKQREKQYAVFGLGRFGTSVALTLNELGYQVMGVDTDEDNVQNLAHELTHVVTADASDERTLRSLGAQNFDVAVVAIGDLEANMMTTLMIKKQREKQYAVFGLGRFGTSVALTLNELGYQVMGVDTDEDNVQNLAHELTHVVTADASDERTLRSLGAQNFDVAVVAIGDLEANMMTTLLLKEMGVPVVVVKAINQVHGKMLEKIGADKIVYSERDMGQRVAHNLISNSIVDYIELSDTISLMSITVPTSLAGKNLIESNLRSRYNVNIVAIKHGSETLVNPDPKMVLNLGDEMIIIGEHDNIKALEEVV